MIPPIAGSVRRTKAVISIVLWRRLESLLTPVGYLRNSETVSNGTSRERIVVNDMPGKPPDSLKTIYCKSKCRMYKVVSDAQKFMIVRSNNAQAANSVFNESARRRTPTYKRQVQRKWGDISMEGVRTQIFIHRGSLS